MDARRYLETVGSEVKGIFVENRSILSFEEWMDAFFRDPDRHARSSAQYLLDAIDHFGSDLVDGPQGKVRRFRLFDRPFDGGRGKVSGQEEAQGALYRILGNFVQARRANKLVLLHGPNGSAKSSIVDALVRGLEIYSRQNEGALYRINWVFPAEKLGKGSIGFGDKAGPDGELATFAHLEPELVDARIPCELKDHPLFLVPGKERRKLVEAGVVRRGRTDFVLSDYIAEGELCHKCRQIYSGLLAAYNGDYLQVLRHIQVERFFVSQRYVSGAVTVEPQLSVDASYLQLTADRSAGALPPALQNLDLFSPFGPLVSANRGLIEYSDLLKRQPESYKYLLGTTETGVLPLEHFLLHLDEVMIATSNEKHLAAFKQAPDFASFKARVELVRVPYLRQASVEQAIYDDQVTRASVGGKHIAPHATRVAALWAVLTRLRRPEPERHPPEVRDLVEDLSPMEKLRLFDDGRAPDRLTSGQARELRKAIPGLFAETEGSPRYEGVTGASAREIKTVIFNAAQNPAYTCLTPLAVLQEIRELCKDRSVYEFLQMESSDGYQDPEGFVELVEAEYLDQIDEEIRSSMGLITEERYHELFERYVVAVSHWVKGEKLRNRITGEYEWPDEARMVELEDIVKPDGEDRGPFRRALISAVGAWRLDHPGSGEVEYAKIFPDLFRRMRDHFFEERKRTLRRNKENVLRYLAEDERDSLLPKDRETVEASLRRLRESYGYCEHCAKDAIAHLMHARYA
ncbi:PrkA family serine protein kinase [Vulgatibacter incomptus]|uniref:Putative serine protein kinase, PrkA n=1 Tax=Vulgatibacter incomptus TaxID=1391653 RepID=A0A0K1PA22_9BACT|nr:serine protein kinase PrkA [Vulgatibacter incomptus]AKU90352.1 putative serine protein kinase, PrkA [Vulgatibacter incomptus]